MSLKLPPLPPLGGETTGRSMVDVITEQHRELLTVCECLTDDTAADRRTIAQVMIATMSRHLSGSVRTVHSRHRKH